MKAQYMTVCLLLSLSGHAQDVIEVGEVMLRPQAIDYAPAYFKNGFVMCSMRERDQLISYEQKGSADPFSDMYFVPWDGSNAGKPSLLDEAFVTPVHDGPATFSANEQVICFTRNQEIPKGLKDRVGKHNRLGLFFSNRTLTGWSVPVPFEYNHEERSMMHPCLSTDGSTLYFASDIPGGYGGADIYYSEWEDGQWTIPLNMGPQVNGTANELFPFMHPSGTLYFSSNRAGGPGGMDIYSTQRTSSGWAPPVALPEPINSNADELGYISRSNDLEGLFSSNRAGDDHIFWFRRTVPPFQDCKPMEQNNYCYVFEEEGTMENDTLPLRYQWDMGDGARITDLYAEHCYKGPGTYKVKLNIIDTLSNTVFFNEASYDLVIADIQQAYIVAVDSVRTDRVFQLDASSTYLPAMNIANYHWDLGDGTTTWGEVITHSYKKPGVHTLRLDVLSQPDEMDVIHNRCVTKQVTVLDKYKAEEDIRTLAVYQDANGKLFSFNYKQLPFDGFELTMQDGQDVLFTVEILTSQERVSLDDEYFDRIRPYYEILERYIPDRQLFSYSVGEEKKLEDAYSVFAKLKQLKYMTAEVLVMQLEKLREIDDLALEIDKVEQLNNTVIRTSTVYFKFAEDHYDKDFEHQLNKILYVLKEHGELDLVIAAHTDAIGTQSNNNDLSARRAEVVKQFFLGEGVGDDRMTAIGYGEDHPIADNDTEEGRKLNRRVEFKLSYRKNTLAGDAGK